MSDETTALVLPERIEPSELTYFKKVMGGLAKAVELEAEAARLLQQATALRGAHDSWVGHLAEQYHLDPTTDQVDAEDGTIQRRDRNGTG